MTGSRKRINLELSEEDCLTTTTSVSVFNLYRGGKPQTKISKTDDTILTTSIHCDAIAGSSKDPTYSSIPSNLPIGNNDESLTLSSNSNSNVGKNFAETFSYLKNTKHYEEPKISDQAPIQETLRKHNPSAIIVNSRQKGNPILKHVRNVPLEYGDINPDYVVGATSCILFLSLRYHALNPEYIHQRLKKLGSMYTLRVLLVQVDTKDPHASLRELAKIGILASCTLILAWSPEEAGRYIETYKSYENKPPDALQERTDNDWLSQMTECLTTIKSLNKTNVVTLASTFGAISDIAKTTEDEVALCPGFGQQKAKRLLAVFDQPFIKKQSITNDEKNSPAKSSTNNTPEKKPS